MKVPKGQSDAINRRRTDMTMIKRKNLKIANNDLQSITQRKLMIEQDEPNLKPGVNYPLKIITDLISKCKSHYHTTTSYIGLFKLKSGVRVFVF